MIFISFYLNYLIFNDYLCFPNSIFHNQNTYIVAIPIYKLHNWKPSPSSYLRQSRVVKTLGFAAQKCDKGRSTERSCSKQQKPNLGVTRMKGCTCMYCYDGLCFKPGKAEEGLIAAPCDGCESTALDPTAHNIIV